MPSPARPGNPRSAAAPFRMTTASAGAIPSALLDLVDHLMQGRGAFAENLPECGGCFREQAVRLMLGFQSGGPRRLGAAADRFAQKTGGFISKFESSVYDDFRARPWRRRFLGRGRAGLGLGGAGFSR